MEMSYYPLTQENYNKLMQELDCQGYAWQGSGRKPQESNMFRYKGGEIVIQAHKEQKVLTWCHKRQVRMNLSIIEV